ncbi:uncharacterized protein LOC118228274 isoform X1 [Anguilla anguilla]|uniref:uncharacterized protein LOC118228274 isoform X1 n=1 Tax=Anguilla anguilla TaxID=7936 RepID=UPI0015B225ED|nr:uncharacterized protein LOC118228274 isoform X1 [Anguilla anguilla]
MSNEILFRTQLASIMEVLANAAVEEICKLVDDGYAVVHLQMSEYQKENEALKVALHLMELKAARSCAERARAPENHLDPYSDGALTLRDKPRGTSKEGPTVAGNRVLGNPGDVCPQGFHPAVEEGNPVTTFSLKQVEPAGADNDRNTCILIKEEIPEGSSNAHADMKIPVQGALDSGAGEEDGVPALGLGVSAAECPQEHRAGRGTAVWECADVEEGRTEALLIKEERSEEDRDPQREINSREERLVEPSLDDGKLAAALGNRSPPSKGREEESDQQRTRRHVWEPTAVEEEEGCEPLPVKEERLGEEGSSSEARGGARSCGERAVERGGATVGGRVPALNTQTAPVRPLEELAEHSAPSGLWELQGFRTGGMQKARKGRSGLGLRHGGADLRPGGRSSLDSEFVLYERPGQLGSYCTQGGAVAETEDPCCSYSAESDPESLTFRSELQRGPPVDGGSGSSLPSLGYLDWKPEAAVVETVKMEAEARSVWNRPVVSRAGHTHPKNYDDDDDDGDEENIHAENIADVCPPFSRMRAGVGGVRDEPSAGAADLNGCGLLRKSFGASVGLGTERRFEAGGGGVYRDSGEAGGLSGPLQMGERQFSCTQCGKLFAHPGRLKVHQRVHTGEKPFSCAQCGKRFAQSSHIKRHQRVHTGEKPFSCTQCGKSFSHLCNLKTHQTVHTGERPYSCTQCGKNFSSLGNLIRHQSVHIGK